MTFDDTWIFRDCPWCGVRHAQFITQAHIQAVRHGKPARYWSVLTCPRCASPVTLETTTPEQAAAIHRTIPNTASEVDVDHLPPDVASYYRDAIRVLEAGVPDAAAVQLRRTLEAAAAHHEIASGPLVQRIKKLIEAGLITNEFGKVLDHIREVGNVGAHASDARVDEETARRALRFTTLFLRNLFEIPAELDAIEADEPEPEQESS